MNSGSEDVDDDVFSPQSAASGMSLADDPTLMEPPAQFNHMLETGSGHDYNDGNDDDVDDVMFSDEATFDQQFDAPEKRIEVHAPPGKLGVVIDTTGEAGEAGAPTVSSIKDMSCLADKVHVGDILTSIDGFNVKGMSASQVSKLIASKANNATRVLVFAR